MAAGADCRRRSAGWRITTLTKAACPPARILSARKEDAAGASCERGGNAALRWLAKESPDLIVLVGGGRIYKLLDETGERIPDERRTSTWQAGLSQTLAALPEPADRAGARRHALPADQPGDVPGGDPRPTCPRCGTPRSAAIDSTSTRPSARRSSQRGRAIATWARSSAPTAPARWWSGDILAWRNRDHITATFATQLAPSMRAAVESALEAE